MKPRILVACEYSGRVRDEFAARGWDAWSCDFEESDTVGQHYHGDVRDLLTQRWDMMIAPTSVPAGCIGRPVVCATPS